MAARSINKIRKSREDIILDTIIYVSLIFLVIVTLYPFINLLAISFNDATDAIRGSIYLLPRKLTLFNYKDILSESTIYSALMISIARTAIGTICALAFSIPLAYILSKKDFVLRRFLNTFMVLTMYFSGGMIPIYFLYRDMHLINNFAVYIIPALISAWNVIILRTYIEGLPESLIESAKIDGANELSILVKIIFPLILPVVATVALFIAVGHWNAWFDTYIYAPGNQSISTLQFELQKKLQSAMQGMSGVANPNFAGNGTAVQASTPQSVRATMTIIATAPILLVYPFLQKYFVSGLTLGGVKG